MAGTGRSAATRRRLARMIMQAISISCLLPTSACRSLLKPRARVAISSGQPSRVATPGTAAPAAAMVLEPDILGWLRGWHSMRRPAGPPSAPGPATGREPLLSPRCLARSIVAALGVVALILVDVLPTSATQGNQGLQGGWAVDPDGHLNFPHSVMSELPYMQQAGAGVLRLNFRLNECFSDWTSAGCSTADGPTALAVYDQVVNAAINTYHLQVIGLLSNEAWHGTQADWTANNAEHTRGTGDNRYVQAFASNAAGVLAKHYAGRISTWEVWNEPNAWTDSPSPGVFTGSTFVYPSNFAWLLRRSYAAIKVAQPGTSSTVISGGLFGHDLGGVRVATVTPSGATQTATKKGTVTGATPTPSTPVCSSSVPSGADYLCNTYLMGQTKAAWRTGA
jgi:hypothetical protein